MTRTTVGLLLELKAAAIQGQAEIENGCWARSQLPDSVFSNIVHPDEEETIIEAMADSGEWIRLFEGFRLRKTPTMKEMTGVMETD